MPSAAITVSPLADAADAAAFRALNEEWIGRFFAMEDADRAVLDDPRASIVDRGGVVLIARDGEEQVGCVALLASGDGVLELVKMAVTPTRQGEGIGRVLITAAIAAAREAGAHRILLESNSVLVPAVRMYESAGFRHIAPHAPSPYARADVFMALELD